MKRIKTLLCILLIFTLFPLNVVSAETQAKTNRYSENYKVLNSLGVLPDISFEENDCVTRKDFARAILALINIPDSTDGVEGEPAPDVTVKETYSYAVAKVLSRNLMYCYDSGNFNPEDNMNFEEVAYAMVKILNYTVTVDKNNYYSKAVELGLFDKMAVSKNLNMTYGDYLQMLVNMLDIDMLKMKYIDGDFSYEVDEDCNFLAEYHDIYKIKDQVIENGDTALIGKTTISENEILTKEGILLNTEIKPRAQFLLGYYADIYYYEDEASDTNSVLYFEPETDDELFVYAKDIIDFKNGTFTYYDENNKTKTVTLSSKMKIIYNGKATNSYSEDMFKPQVGDVTFLKSERGGKYDIAIVMDYENYVVQEIEPEEGILQDRMDISKKLIWDSSDVVRVYAQDYTVLSISSVQPGSIVSVAKSEDEEIIWMMINKNTVSGTVDSTYAEDNEKYIIVDGKEYHIAKSYEDYVNVKPSASVTLYFDFDGSVAYIDITASGAYTVAYLISQKNTRLNEEEGVSLKLFDGEVKHLDCYDNIKVNGKRYTSYTELPSSIRDGILIRYKKNADGQIIEIDTPYMIEPERNESADSLHYMGAVTTATTYMSGAKNFSGRLMLEDDVKVFVVPSDKSQYEQYKIAGASIFSNTGAYSGITGFSDVESAEKASYVLYDLTDIDAGVYSDYAQRCIIEGFEDVLFEDEVHKQISYYHTTSAELNHSIVSNNLDVSALNVGDVVRFATDSNGNIVSYQLVFDRANMSLRLGAGHAYYSSYRTVFSKVYKKYKSSFRVALNPALISNEYDTEIIPMPAMIFVYDSVKNKITIGNETDIVDYKYGLERCSDVFVDIASGVSRAVVVYK